MNQIQATPADPIYSISSRLSSGYWAKINKFGPEQAWSAKDSEYYNANNNTRFAPSRLRLWAAKPGAVVLIVIAAVESAVYWVFRNEKRFESSAFTIQWNWKTITDLTTEKHCVPTQEIFARNWVDESHVRPEDLFAVDRLRSDALLKVAMYCDDTATTQHGSFRLGIRSFLGFESQYLSMLPALPDDPGVKKAFAAARNLDSDVVQYVLTRSVWNRILEKKSNLRCMHPDSGTEIYYLNDVLYGKAVKENERLRRDWFTALKQNNSISHRNAISDDDAEKIGLSLSRDPTNLPCFKDVDSFTTHKEHPFIQHLLKPIVNREIQQKTMWITQCLPRAQQIVAERL